MHRFAGFLRIPRFWTTLECFTQTSIWYHIGQRIKNIASYARSLASTGPNPSLFKLFSKQETSDSVFVEIVATLNDLSRMNIPWHLLERITFGVKAIHQLQPIRLLVTMSAALTTKNSVLIFRGFQDEKQLRQMSTDRNGYSANSTEKWLLLSKECLSFLRKHMFDMRNMSDGQRWTRQLSRKP